MAETKTVRQCMIVVPIFEAGKPSQHGELTLSIFSVSTTLF